MSRIFFLALFIISSITLGQSEGVDPNNNTLLGIANLGANSSAFGSTSLIRNPRKPIDGTVYLFDTWSNSSIVVSADDKKIRLNNINFNAQRNTFQSKVNSDSIFTFNFRNLEKVIIKNKTFKNVYSPILKRYRVYEIVAETEEFTILKDYTIDIKEGNPNPQRGSLNDKYVVRDNYFVSKGETFEKFQRKKSKVLKLMGDKASKVGAYAKANKLSYKKDTDFTKIIEYYKNL